MLLDGYQSAGIIPVDVTALGVDFFVGGCLKWLCGGPGTAFLYTRPDMPAVQPRFTGWFSHRAPFAFDIGAPEPRGDAMRMMNGRLRSPRSTPRSRGSTSFAPSACRAFVRHRGDDGPVLALADQSASRPWRHVIPIVSPARWRSIRRTRWPFARVESARLHCGLPGGCRHPRVAAFLQHDGGDRPPDGGTGLHRPAQAIRQGTAPTSVVT